MWLFPYSIKPCLASIRDSEYILLSEEGALVETLVFFTISRDSYQSLHFELYFSDWRIDEHIDWRMHAYLGRLISG